MDSVLTSSEEIGTQATNLAHRLIPGDHATTVALYGELGAGKTTFVKYLVKALGGGERVISPTFILLRTYRLSHPHFLQLVHIDAYRLTSEGEASALDLPRYFKDPQNIVCIEWAEKIQNLLPNNALQVFLSHHPEGRTLSYGNL